MLEEGAASDLVDEKKTKTFFWLSTVQEFLAGLLAWFLGMSMLLPAGMLIFPETSEDLLGISMVVMSTAVSTFVFGLFSELPVGLGLMIAENIPMLNSLAWEASVQLKDGHVGT